MPLPRSQNAHRCESVSFGVHACTGVPEAGTPPATSGTSCGSAADTRPMPCTGSGFCPPPGPPPGPVGGVPHGGSMGRKGKLGSPIPGGEGTGPPGSVGLVPGSVGLVPGSVGLVPGSVGSLQTIGTDGVFGTSGKSEAEGHGARCTSGSDGHGTPGKPGMSGQVQFGKPGNEGLAVAGRVGAPGQETAGMSGWPGHGTSGDPGTDGHRTSGKPGTVGHVSSG